MPFLTLILILLITQNLFAVEQDQLISKNDIDFLFKNNVKKWNQSVVFFDKKNSMTKVNNNDQIYNLKSLFSNGTVTIKPFFIKNKVSKINLKYELKNFDQNLNNLIFQHYTELKNNYCINIIDKKNIINIEINECD